MYYFSHDWQNKLAIFNKKSCQYAGKGLPLQCDDDI